MCGISGVLGLRWLILGRERNLTAIAKGQQVEAGLYALRMNVKELLAMVQADGWFQVGRQEVTGNFIILKNPVLSPLSVNPALMFLQEP